MRAKIMMVLRVVVSLGFLGLLIWNMRGHLPRIADTLTETSLALFSLAVGLFLCNITLLSMRLNLLFAGEGLRISPGKVMQLTLIGFFFNNFMPTAVGGDIVKAYYAQRQTGETAKSFIAVFMDRFIGLFSFICIAVLALLLSWKNIDFALKKIVLIFALAGIAGFLLILNDSVAKVIFGALRKFKLWNIGERISKAYKAVHEYKNKKGTILAVIAVSLITQSIYFWVVYLLGRSLGADFLLKTVFLLMPIVCVVSMLPSLGGLGLREGAIVALFGPVIGTEKAFSVSILLLASLLVISLVGALIYVFAAQFKVKKGEISKLETYDV